MAGQMLGDCTFARACRPVNGHNDLSAWLNRANGAICRAHPRFFVLCLDDDVKSNRLTVPALAPVVRAGLRLLRTGRASGRASLRGALLLLTGLPLRTVEVGFAAVLLPLLWPLPWPGAGEVGLALCVRGATWAELLVCVVPPLPDPVAGREPL